MRSSTTSRCAGSVRRPRPPRRRCVVALVVALVVATGDSVLTAGNGAIAANCSARAITSGMVCWPGWVIVSERGKTSRRSILRI